MSTSRKVPSGPLPTRLFTYGTEPEFTKSFTYYSGLENVPILSTHIPLEELDQIRNGPLGVLLRFYENGFMWSAKIVHELLVNQLVTKKKYEFWTLCAGQAMRFSLKEFEMITGLNCEAYPTEHTNVVDDPQFWRRLGLMENKEISYNMVKEKLINCKDWDSRDRIRLVYLFLVSQFLLARHPRKGIVSEAINLVLDREKFEAYPWGRVAFQYLIESIFKAQPDLSNKSYGVNGFVQVLQVWVYEVINAIGKKCGQPRKDMMEFPPLLRWKGSRKRCKFDLPQHRELVSVKSVMNDVITSVWDDEIQDVKVDNMLLLISGSSDKASEKHFWEDKGLIDGPGNMVGEEYDQAENEGVMPLRKKSKSKVIDGNNNDILKTYFLSSVEQMTEKLLKEISTYVNSLVQKMDSRMEKIEESIKVVQETGKNIEARMTTFEACSEKVQEAEHTKENDSKKHTTCSNKTSGKKSKSVLSRYELKDISVEDLPTEEDSVDCEKGNANSREQEESSVKTLSEASSIRDRNMKIQMDKFTKGIEAFLKKPMGKEKRIRKLTAPLKHPFISINTINKNKPEDQPCTAYDPFELVDETLVTTLDKWITRNVTVVCGSSHEKVGKIFFRHLRTPQTYISNNHIDAGMTLFRRRLLMNPCPYRGGRMAFMDTVFTWVISHHYKEFDKNPKKYKWNSTALSYYNGVLPSAGCTNKQLGKDVDEIYMVINIKGNHWAALDISIPSRTIHVYDSIVGYTDEKEMEKYVMPYARMVPYMLKAFASEKDKKGMSVAKYKISRKYDIPQNIITGDCGVYAIKYIECLALGCQFTGLCDKNIKKIRAKLAAEIFDGSKNMGFY